MRHVTTSDSRMAFIISPSISEKKNLFNWFHKEENGTYNYRQKYKHKIGQLSGILSVTSLSNPLTKFVGIEIRLRHYFLVYDRNKLNFSFQILH